MASSTDAKILENYLMVGFWTLMTSWSSQIWPNKEEQLNNCWLFLIPVNQAGNPGSLGHPDGCKPCNRYKPERPDWRREVPALGYVGGFSCIEWEGCQHLLLSKFSDWRVNFSTWEKWPKVKSNRMPYVLRFHWKTCFRLWRMKWKMKMKSFKVFREVGRKTLCGNTPKTRGFQPVVSDSLNWTPRSEQYLQFSGASGILSQHLGSVSRHQISQKAPKKKAFTAKLQGPLLSWNLLRSAFGALLSCFKHSFRGTQVMPGQQISTSSRSASWALRQV